MNIDIQFIRFGMNIVKPIDPVLGIGMDLDLGFIL